MRTLDQIQARIQVVVQQIVRLEHELTELHAEHEHALVQQGGDIRAILRRDDPDFDRWLSQKGK